jgi:hypothetical protein
MKKQLILILFLGFTTAFFAQRGDNDRVKAFKTAFITERLDLSSKEAQQFWPVYNDYRKKEKQLKKVRLNKIKIANDSRIDNLSNQETDKILDDLLDIEGQLYDAKKSLVAKLRKVISTKKVIKLFKAEQEFNKKLLERLRARRAKRKD